MGDRACPFGFPCAPNGYWSTITELSEGSGIWTGAFWENILLLLPDFVFDIELEW